MALSGLTGLPWRLASHVPCVSVSQGYRVGSEFWSLPPRFGDELSGITSTLTQTEQGKQKAVTRVAQPRIIRQETGTQPSAPSSCSFWVYIRPRHSIYLISGSCFNLRLTALSLCEIFHLQGTCSVETQRLATRSWAQSAYLQRKRQEVQEVLRGRDIKKPVNEECTRDCCFGCSRINQAMY